MRSPTIPRRWFDAHRLVVGLALVVAALTLLAYWAWQASVRRHDVAIELLRSHAELAAQRLGARIQNELYVGATAIFRPITGGRGGTVGSVPEPETVLAAAHDAERCRCVPPFRPAYAARTDLTGRGMRFTGARIPAPDAQRAMVEAIGRQVARMPPGWEVAVASGTAPGDGHLVLFTRVGATDSPNYLAVATDSATFREFVVRPLLDNTPLLAGRASAVRAHNDSLVAIRIATASGVPLYQSAGVRLDSTTASATRFPVEWGELIVEASLRPQAAALILPGGVPRSPIPTLVGLLAIAAVLVAVASLLVWRMHELARIRADFTSSVSHELRTPLTQLLLYAETLEMGRQRSEAKRAEAIGVIARETRRLIHLVENVLHYSRAERSLTRLDRRLQELGGLVADTVRTFTPVAQARASTIDVRVHGPVHARVDGDAMRRVVLNLLENAVRYGPMGQAIVVRVERDGAWARIVVEDEGPGVPRDREDDVWRPYVRLESPDGDATAGCGIGLAIVSDIVAAHGGRRWVRSRTGVGAAFFVDVPAASPDPYRQETSATDRRHASIGTLGRSAP